MNSRLLAALLVSFCGCIVLPRFSRRHHGKATKVPPRRLSSPTLVPTSDEWVRQPTDLIHEVSSNYNDKMSPSCLPTENSNQLDPQGRPFVPPLFMRPPQESNKFMNFTEQVLRYNLNTYQASPAYSKDPVPKSRILHFIFIAEPPNRIVMNLMHYLVVRAAYLRYQPYEIYLHMNQLPDESCPYWKMMRPMVKVIHTELVHEIFGRKVSGLSHMSDVIRLEAVMKYGGFYMDTDIVSVRPLTDDMWDPPSKMMLVSEKNEKIASSVFSATKDSPMLLKWLDGFHKFDDTIWASVIDIITKLCQQYPTEVHVERSETFFDPLYYLLPPLFEVYPDTMTDLPSFDQSYGIHYWNSYAKREGYHDDTKLSVSDVLFKNTGMHQVLRTVLPSPFISISIDCKDGVEAIRGALDSILEQEFPLWEILILEDSTGDAFSTLQCRKLVFDEFVPKHERLSEFGRRYISFVPASMQVEDLSQSVWHVHLKNAAQLKPGALLQGVQETTDKPLATEITLPGAGGLKLEHVFDPERPLLRVTSPHLIESKSAV